ncbi:hypothetical protein [Celeribacter marinus]|uniref:hypothetical protein n=1 Tax=Celeribacter marinus TaxID=1397108 RepID=UPI003F6A8C1C
MKEKAANVSAPQQCIAPLGVGVYGPAHKPFASFARSTGPFMPRAARFFIPLAVIVISVSGCSDRPDLTGRVAPAAKGTAWPTLLPSDQLTTDADTDASGAAQTAKDLSARAAALRARAARLAATPVLSSAERARLSAAANE